MATYLEMVKLRVALKKIIKHPDKKSLIEEMISKSSESYNVSYGHSLSNFEFNNFKETINNAKNTTLGQYLQQLVDSKDIKKDSIIYTKANIRREYWNKLLHDKYEKPSKNKLIRIGLALELNCSEVNELLKMAGYSFKPNSQDSAILWFFDNKEYNFENVNELLITCGLQSIFDDKELA